MCALKLACTHYASAAFTSRKKTLRWPLPKSCKRIPRRTCPSRNSGSDQLICTFFLLPSILQDHFFGVEKPFFFLFSNLSLLNLFWFLILLFYLLPYPCLSLLCIFLLLFCSSQSKLVMSVCLFVLFFCLSLSSSFRGSFLKMRHNKCKLWHGYLADSFQVSCQQRAELKSQEVILKYQII